MMQAFVLIAGALTAAMAVLLIRPLLRRRADDRPVDAVTAGVVSVILFALGGGLYALLSEYPWVEAPVVADTPAARAASLANELARKPDDPQGWMQLGNLYFDLEQYPLATRAFQRADRLYDGKNAAAISAHAETLLAQDFENIRGTAGRMFERVLEMEPNNPKALLYSALAAMGRGENDTARQRFQRMLAQNPPAQIRSIIEKQLQAMDAVDAGAGETPAADAAQAQVRVRITVSPSLRYEVTGNSALFVAARDPNQPGPPFAAKRLPLTFPVEVTLTAADAMLPQRHIAAGQTLDVVARISLDGQPQSASGDPFGQVSYHVGRDGRLDIVIDKLAP
ncbi:MAG TPA: tetratricopeptide repeat protein [Steroidobacteraceae bacterium]